MLSLQSRIATNVFAVNNLKFKEKENQFASLPGLDPSRSKPFLPKPFIPGVSQTEAPREPGGQNPPKLSLGAVSKHSPLIFCSSLPVRKLDLELLISNNYFWDYKS